jgi:hypothetical protein
MYTAADTVGAYGSIRQHTAAYVSIRQHTSAYVSIRQHTSAYPKLYTAADTVWRSLEVGECAILRELARYCMALIAIFFCNSRRHCRRWRTSRVRSTGWCLISRRSAASAAAASTLRDRYSK